MLTQLRRRAPIRILALLALSVACMGALTAVALGETSGGAGSGTATTPTTTTTPAPAPAPQGGRSPFGYTGMWIWELPRSSGGSVSAIAARARHYRIGTVFIKSSDGSNSWRQFTSSLVRSLRARGLRVCAWQYVYGTHPETEAKLGARARQLGAQCLVIDAEAEYEGRYAAAQRYITVLRRAVGGRYPVSLAGFPYVDYHPAFPYSVFMGAGGAQYNQPQMYWKAIGTSVDRVYSHTYRYNRPYARGVAPLGQTYDRVRARDITRFRLLARAYRALGISWWDWQEARPSDWHEIGRSLRPLRNFRPDTSYATLSRGARGDLVVWAQEHLRSAGGNVRIDGVFGAATVAAVRSFRAAHGLPAGTSVDSATWRALLRYAPARVDWTRSKARSASAAGASARPSAPASAHDRAKGYEIPRKRH